MIDQPQIQVIDDALGDAARALDLLKTKGWPAVPTLAILKDRAISEALKEIQPLWTDAEIARRCVIFRSVGDPRETLFVDGIAVLTFEEPQAVQTWTADQLSITFTQKFRRIQAVKL